jgi:hypothetical protein
MAAEHQACFHAADDSKSHEYVAATSIAVDEPTSSAPVTSLFKWTACMRES